MSLLQLQRMSFFSKCIECFIELIWYFICVGLLKIHFCIPSIRLLRMSPSIGQIGGVVWPVFWCNVICWIIVYLCICNGVKSVGKVSFPIFTDWSFLARCRFVSHKINIKYFFLKPSVLWIVVYFCSQIVYFTVMFPYVVLCVLFIRGVTLPGAWKGILFYILPDWGQLKKPKVSSNEAKFIHHSPTLHYRFYSWCFIFIYALCRCGWTQLLRYSFH